MANKKNTNRELMEKAIEVMNQSINEPREDGKVPPKVGAVILFPDGRIETAYRGELREGDHAEFTLIERKLANSNLSDCVLFTTLEPCVERNSPKVPCCRRTTNARIKTVFVGIEDPDPTVDGKGIKHLHNHGVKVELFDKDLAKIIEKENEQFIKQALDRKYKDENEHEELRGQFEFGVLGYDKSRLSDKAIKKFIELAKIDYEIDDDRFWQFLADCGVMARSQSGEFTPTGFGILLFGADPRANYHQAVLKASITYGDGKVENRDFSGPLVLMPEEIEEWLHKVLPLVKDASKFRREDVTSYPIDVLREAVLNALVHRDYERADASCSLKITDDMITIVSPGKPVPEISMNELNSFEAPSLRRNPIITYILSRMNYVEEKGFGMDTFKSIKDKHGYPFPVYSYKEPYLTLSMPRSFNAVKITSKGGDMNALDEQEVKSLELFRTHEKLSKSQFVELTKMPQRSAERTLQKFTELGLLERVGQGRSVKYRRPIDED